jgi:hypothetical protein
MKKLSIKKLVAIATGAALVGTAVAPIVGAAFTSLQKSDVISSTSGQPVVSVVAGVNANVSDFVWAGNIAARVAQLATKTMSVQSGSGDGNSTLSNVSIDLTVGGTTTVSGGKQFNDSYLVSTQGSTTGGQYEFGRSTTVAGLTLTGSRPIALTNSQIPSLYQSTDTIRYNGTDSTVTMKETIGINADARFDGINQSVYDLAMYMPSEGDFNYAVDLGTGIYRYETVQGTTDFQDDVNDNQRIPLFGKRYVVQQVANTNTSKVNYIRLIEDTSKQTFGVDDTFTVKGKAGYAWAGKTLTVKVAQVGQSAAGGAYTVKFTLYDEDGSVINSQSSQRKNYVQFQDAEGNYIVQDSIYFDDILVSNTQDLSTASVDMYVGASSVDLYDGKGFPYDQSNTNGPWNWKVSTSVGTGSAGSSTDANKLVGITISNSKLVWDSQNPIYPTTSGQSLRGHTGSVVKLLQGSGSPNEGYAYVDFRGFEEKESTTTVKVGNNNIQYKDTGGQQHDIPFYINLGLSSSGNSFTFDTKTWYYQTNSNDVNFTIGNDNNRLNGVAVDFNGTPANRLIFDGFGITDVNIGVAGTQVVDINRVTYTCTTSTTAGYGVNCKADGNITFAKAPINTATASDYSSAIQTSVNKSWYYDDGNTAKNDEYRAYTAAPVVLEGANGQTYSYALYVNESYSPSVWLLLANQTLSTEYTKSLKFEGTDTQEGGDVEATDPQYYYPDALAIGGDPSDNSFYVAAVGVDNNTSNAATVDYNVYFDTATANTVTYPNTNLSMYSSDVNFSSNLNGNAQAWTLRNDEPYLHAAYSDWGSKISLDSGVMTSVMPQNRKYIVMVVGGSGTSTTPTGGDSLTGLKLNETQTTPAGTKITVTSVTGSCGGAGVCTPASFQKTVSLANNLVYTDATPPSGKVVIVGGYLVNSLAQNLTLSDGTTLQDALTKGGDMVAEQLSNGNIVVAGYTASDTGAAAQELIAALDAWVE